MLSYKSHSRKIDALNPFKKTHFYVLFFLKFLNKYDKGRNTAFVGIANISRHNLALMHD